MAKKCYEALFSLWIFVMVAILLTNHHEYVDGRKITRKETTHLERKGTIKTIQSIEDGDVIDCVDIHKQPAFDHPLITELQMEPSSYPSGLQETKSSEPELLQLWRKNDDCPEGTIPIRRTPKVDVNHTPVLKRLDQPSFHEYATVTQRGAGLHGGRGSFSVWSPRTEPTEFSLAQIWVAADAGDISTVNTIEAGWMVYPGRFNNTRPSFFIFWSKDYYKTACYDVDCPAFVQTSRKFALGSAIAPVSTYGGKSFEITINIFKDKSTGNWWVQIQGENIGYYPKTIFNTLADGATVVSWGGEIVNYSPRGHHTTTEMGSGHFPSEGFGTSYFRNIQIIDSTDTLVDPNDLKQEISKPSCYDLIMRPKDPGFGTHFYYGGPGFSPKCS